LRKDREKRYAGMASMQAKMKQGGMDWNACRSIEHKKVNQSTGK
jgi:hypothetical protein